MRGIDAATARVIALIALLVVAAAALRGYVPAAGRASHRQATENPATLVFLIVLLGVSLGIVAVSIVARLRDRRAAAGGVRALPTSPGASEGRPSWRVLLIGLAVLAAWLLILWLLTRWTGQHSFDSAVPVPGAHTDAPVTNLAPPPTDTAPRPEPARQNPSANMFRYLALTSLVMLVLTAVAAVFAARTRRSGAKPPGPVAAPLGVPAPVSEPESLVRAAELGLAEMGNLSREPREAIIGCYAAMERELEHVPDAMPQDCDTPTEVLARAVEHHALPADNAIHLVNLFAEARFSPHLMTEQHRDDAVRTLELVLAELRSPV